jgi:hypothetical protein
MADLGELPRVDELLQRTDLLSQESWALAALRALLASGCPGSWLHTRDVLRVLQYLQYDVLRNHNSWPEPEPQPQPEPQPEPGEPPLKRARLDASAAAPRLDSSTLITTSS